MEELQQKITDLVRPVCDELGVHLVDIDLRGHRNNQVLSVYADTEEGITLQQITDLTRKIEDILDMEDPLPGKYRLEVSSPGLDRPLQETWQFRKNAGRQLRVTYLNAENDKKETISGELKLVSDTGIVLQLNKNEITIPMASIEKAVVKTNW